MSGLLADRKRLVLIQIGILLLLYSVGTFIRLAPVDRWGVYVTADDPVLHVRVTQYVYEHGHLPRNDSLAWYPWGQNWERTLPNFRYYLTAFLYRLFRLLGSHMSLYDFCVFFPAFFAPLAVFPMFLLVRELKDWKSGLVASAILVVSSGYLTRTIAGFYRHEQVGIPLLVLCMYLFARAMRAERLRDNLAYAASSGVTLAVLTGTWSGFRFLMDGFAVYIIVLLVLGRMKKNYLWAFALAEIIALASTFMWPNLSYRFWKTTEFAVPIVVMLVAAIHLYFLERRLDATKRPVAVVVLAAVIFGAMLATTTHLPRGRYELVVNPLRRPAPGDVSQTVAEHASMQLTVQQTPQGVRMEWPALESYGVFLFLVPFGILMPFLRNRKTLSSEVAFLSMLAFATFLLFMALEPFSALICLVIMLLSLVALWFLSPDNLPSDLELMAIVLTVLASYFFKDLIRLNVLFSVFVSIQSALCAGWVLEMISMPSQTVQPAEEKPVREVRSRTRRSRRRRKKIEKREREPAEPARPSLLPEVLVLFTVVLFVSWSAVSSFKAARSYSLGLRPDWFEALDWIEKNSNPEDVIMSWWDYGYWIETYAHRPTIADGATTNSTQIRELAKAFITTESQAYSFCKKFDVRYVVVDVTADFWPGAKWTAMAVIAKQRIQDYMGMQEGKPVIYDKGSQCLLFRLASRAALSKPLPLEHFEYRKTFSSNRGQVIVYEFVP